MSGAGNPAAPGASHRAGVAALLGRPNAGKSTLLNRLVGEKLAIVTPRPQTTRGRMLGILSREDAQILWLDTPGLNGGHRALDAAMAEQVEEAVRDCDVAVLLVDPRGGFGADHRALVGRIAAAGKPLLAVASCCDLPAAGAAPWPPPELPAGTACLRVSARSGAGVEALSDAVVAHLPASPPLYDPEQLSDRPLRFLAAERVRESAFFALAQELPYRLAVEIAEFDESRADLVRIRAELIVERDSQKRIVIGRGGEMAKRIGVRARRELEAWLGRQVHLELRVAVEPRWTRNPSRIRALGYV